jgi:hypothetical protein
MFNSIRPALKQATRATRTFSSQSAGKSNAVRNTAMGASALLAVTYALSQKQVVRMDDRVPRESVLDSHSLKESLHKRPGKSSTSLLYVNGVLTNSRREEACCREEGGYTQFSPGET